MNAAQQKLGMVALMAVLFVSSLGGWLLAGAIEGQGVGACLSMHATALCHNDTAGHLATWQQFFSPTVAQLSVVFLLVLLSLVLCLTFVPTILTLVREQVAPLFSRWRESALFEPLHGAFARGILNTKAY